MAKAKKASESFFNFFNLNNFYYSDIKKTFRKLKNLYNINCYYENTKPFNHS